VKFTKSILNLKDKDLSRYKAFLLDQILGEQPENRQQEIFRSEILDRIEETNREIDRRNGRK